MTQAFLTERELRTLRVTFLAFVAIGVVTYLLADASPLQSLVAGGTIGGLVFVPLALVYGLYLLGKRRAGTRA